MTYELDSRDEMKNFAAINRTNEVEVIYILIQLKRFQSGVVFVFS